MISNYAFSSVSQLTGNMLAVHASQNQKQGWDLMWLGVTGKARVCEVQFTATYNLWSLEEYHPTNFGCHVAYSKCSKYFRKR